MPIWKINIWIEREQPEWAEKINIEIQITAGLEVKNIWGYSHSFGERKENIRKTTLSDKDLVQ